MAQPSVGFGEVRHTRLRPVHHAFNYPTFFLMVPMRAMQSAPRLGQVLARNRPALLSFYDADHGDGRGPQQGGALAWVQELLDQQQIQADGEIWLHCYPRVMGYTFKPVSFWYCHNALGGLEAIVCEVNNTFGERHVYLLQKPRYGVDLVADKVFFVSPFCKVQGRYHFRFMRTQDRTVVRIEYFDDELSFTPIHQPLLITSVQGHLEPLTAQALRRALWQFPWMTLMVTVRIHWQAFKLWRRRVTIFRKPSPPAELVSVIPSESKPPIS